MALQTGMFGRPFSVPGPMSMGGPAVMPQQPAATPEPSFFGQGGTGRNIAGAIGDALLQSQHMQPIYAPQMDERRRMQQQAALLQQKQQAEMFAPQHVGDSIVQRDPTTGAYNSVYTAPQTPKTGSIETNFDFFTKIDPTGKLARKYAENQSDPMIGVDVYNQQTGETMRQFMPRSGGSSGAIGAGTVPDGAVQMLQKNPALAPQFDQKYGQGASQRYLQGGAAPSGTGTFQPGRGF